MHEDLENAETILGISLPNLIAAAEWTRDSTAKFESEVDEYLNKSPNINIVSDLSNIDLVLLGSLGRQEATTGSDCDYIILQNGSPPHVSQRLLEIADKVREDLHFEEPGPQGTFGGVVIAANLYERIGLENDTNQNLTHRILFLTESVSVLKGKNTYDGIIDHILSRYCADYLPPNKEAGKEARVPRHFVNDLVRFWRTMAVDFGAKRWRSSKDNNYLRLVKLRTSRKVLFAGPLSTLLLVPHRVKKAEDMQSYLRKFLSKPPLAQLASIVTDSCIEPQVIDSTKEALRDVLIAYDRLLGLFPEMKRILKLKEPTTEEQSVSLSKLKEQCEQIVEKIQTGLEVIFFDEPLFKKLVRKYSLF